MVEVEEGANESGNCPAGAETERLIEARERVCPCPFGLAGIPEIDPLLAERECEARLFCEIPTGTAPPLLKLLLWICLISFD